MSGETTGTHAAPADTDNDYLAEIKALVDAEAGEMDWWRLGPFDGGIPGFVRRVRRILDVSQRELAAMLHVSQSAVARWETGRTSPRLSVFWAMLDLARLRLEVRDQGGAEVIPMRDDGARDRAGRRYPAHVDIRALGWWVPSRQRTGVVQVVAQRRSRATRDVMVTFHLRSWRRHCWRLAFGTPVDHPARPQLVADAVAADEWVQDRVRERRLRSA
jgi:HTH-type transcriptional regulator/antitoxin HipB